jgi:mannosyltransferase OCH1-like enzyme
MNKNVEYLKSGNPEFEVLIYDEDMCREFIKNNFNNNVLDAYNKLKPCSYKSDLWRFCVLYKNGGIYVDIKYRCINNFKLVALTEKEYFVKDLDSSGCGTYTALIVTLPQNQIMWNCIQQIVENVKNQYYGENPLYPTGPCLLGNFSTKDEKNTMELHYECTIIENFNNNSNIYYIMFRDFIILTPYKQYRDEQKRTQKFESYDSLWHKKDIYYT